MLGRRSVSVSISISKSRNKISLYVQYVQYKLYEQREECCGEYGEVRGEKAIKNLKTPVLLI